MGIRSLTRALYAWSFLAIGVMAVVALLLGNDAGQVVAEMNSDPAAMAEVIYELLSTVSVFSAAFDLYGLFIFVATINAAYRLFSGSRLLSQPYRVIAKTGSAIGLAGSALAFMGYVLPFIVKIAPRVSGSISAAVIGPLVLMPLPLPWPMAIGLPLWCVGMIVEAIALVFAFRSEHNVRGERLSLVLAIGLALLVIPMLGMIVALFASSKLEGIES
ncbi:hypothetical protein PQ610_06880 [Tardisphaera miroshnichenkoae]